MLGYEREVGVKVEIRRHDSKGVMWSREHKICKPPTAGSWSVYLDGSLTPKLPLRELVEETWLQDAEMALFKHPWRDCAYDEIDACVKVKKITAKKGADARAVLESVEFPRHWGLWATGMLARKTNSRLQESLSPSWFSLVQKANRDQIWLPVVLWKLKARQLVHTIDADIFRSEYLRFRRHG